MRGLHKLTAAANRIEAMRDWENMANTLIALGPVGIQIVDDNTPLYTDGWKTIDKKTKRMRKQYEEIR